MKNKILNLRFFLFAFVMFFGIVFFTSDSKIASAYGSGLDAFYQKYEIPKDETYTVLSSKKYIAISIDSYNTSSGNETYSVVACDVPFTIAYGSTSHSFYSFVSSDDSYLSYSRYFISPTSHKHISHWKVASDTTMYSFIDIIDDSMCSSDYVRSQIIGVNFDIQFAGQNLVSYDNFPDFVNGENLNLINFDLLTYYEVKEYKYISIVKYVHPNETFYMLAFSNFSPNFRVDSVDGPVFDAEKYYQIGFHNDDTAFPWQSWYIKKIGSPRFDDSGLRLPYYMTIPNRSDDIASVVFSNFKMSYGGVDYFTHLGSWGDWGYQYKYDADMFEYNNFQLMLKTGTKDTYIAQWEYPQQSTLPHDLRNNAYELLVSKTVDGVTKSMVVCDIRNWLSSDQNKHPSDRYYEFDLSDLAMKFADKAYPQSNEEYVYPDTISIRHVQYYIPERTVYFDDYDNVRFNVTDDGKIVRWTHDKKNNDTGETDTDYHEDVPEGKNWIDTPEPGIIEELPINTDDALSSVGDTFKSMGKFLGQLPVLMQALFPFLPVEIILFLGLIVALVIILRIAGR